MATSELKERGVATSKERFSSGRLRLQQDSGGSRSGAHSSGVQGSPEAEEEYEEVELDPLVFDRDEFNSG